MEVKRRWLTVSFVFVLLLSCRTAPTPPPEPFKVEPSPKSLPKVALVLGGGAAKGFAHVGVIRVLEKEKIPIDMIVATSVGALVGAIYASERDSFQLEWLAYQVTKEDIFDFSILYSKLGPVQGEKLEEFLKTKLKVKKLEDLELPLYPVATDLMTGETVTLVKGSVARAVRASSAIPGVFVPVQFAGRTLIDGGVTNNLPIEIARQKGADVVIAVNLTQDVKNVQIDSVIDIILQSIDIMGKELLKYKRQGAEVLIEPQLGDVGTMDFSQKKKCIEEGMKAARKALPQIQQKIEDWRQK
jgi:NTE family protein